MTTQRACRIAHAFIHAAVDDHYRLAYAEVLAGKHTFIYTGSAPRAGVLRRARHQYPPGVSR
jgi:hypothetical protein